MANQKTFRLRLIVEVDVQAENEEAALDKSPVALVEQSLKHYPNLLVETVYDRVREIW